MEALRLARNVAAVVLLAMSLLPSRLAGASQYSYVCAYKRNHNCVPNLLSGRCNTVRCVPSQYCSNTGCSH